MSARTSLEGFGAPPRLQGYQTSGDYSGLGMDSVHSSQNLGLFEGSPSWGAVDSPATPATGYSLFAAGTGGQWLGSLRVCAVAQPSPLVEEG